MKRWANINWEQEEKKETNFTRLNKEKKEREKEMKKYGANFYEDYEYSKKLLGTVSGAWKVRLISSMCAPNHCHYLKVHFDTSVTD